MLKSPMFLSLLINLDMPAMSKIDCRAKICFLEIQGFVSLLFTFRYDKLKPETIHICFLWNFVNDKSFNVYYMF